MQVVTLIILAVLAGAVLYQLYAVLGRKVGRQPEDEALEAAARARSIPAERADDEPPVVLTGMAALRARDAGFDLAKFLSGARAAYEMIVVAFAERETKGETETVEFLHPPRGDLEDVNVDGDVVRIRVRFLAELRSRTTSDAGDAVDDRRTAEVWTFERNLTSRDPNWVLVRVESAEA